jgi:hypothetical protein
MLQHFQLHAACLTAFEIELGVAYSRTLHAYFQHLHLCFMSCCEYQLSCSAQHVQREVLFGVVHFEQ